MRHPAAWLVVAILEDEFQLGRLTAERFAVELADVTWHYGLRITRRDSPGTLEQIMWPGQEVVLLEGDLWA